MKVIEAYTNFIQSKRADGLSERSIDAYMWQCKPFIDKYGLKELSEVKTEDIQRFLIDLQGNKVLSASSIISYRRSAKIFLKWCVEEYDDALYRYDKIKLHKMPKKETAIYTPEEIGILLDACNTKPEWVSCRNRLMLAMLIDTGMRRSEISTLKKSKIDFSTHMMIVTGKGNKQRKIHYGDTVAEYMQEYLEKCPYEADTLFCGLHSETLSGNAISQVLYKIQKATGIQVSPHRCRHNFATNYCLDIRAEGKEVDPNKLQALMGHEDIITTKRYIHDALEITAAETCPSHLDIITNKKTAS